MKISNNFWLSELTESSTAERTGGKMLAEQQSPSSEVIENLEYHINTTVQPARDYLGVGITINSGYRGPLLNKAVKGSKKSEHCFGMATDQVLSNHFFDEDSFGCGMENIIMLIEEITGFSPVRGKPTNSTYFLWAYYCLNIHRLDINQVIHEYGSDGAPRWIHVSSSKVKNKRQMLIKRKGEGYVELSLKESLMLGC
jgi:hypothetical protein